MKEDMDKIVYFENENHYFNQHETDFKAEVVASGLKEQGYDPERTLILRLGNTKRGFSKDIESIRPEYSQYDLIDYLNIYVNRKSIYDELPEGIFHRNVYHKDKNSKEEVLDEIRIHREEEFFARQFFRPFEITLDYMLVDFQNKERRIDKMNIYRDFVDAFALQWPVLGLLPVEKAVMLVRMLAYIEQITGSLEKISECMTILMDVPVMVRLGEKCLTVADREKLPRLGKVRLGDNMVLGHTFDDGTFRTLIEIGPLSARKMESFMPGAVNCRIFNELIDMFLPADKDVRIRYIIRQEDAVFRLASPDGKGAYLGISTYL